MTTYRKASLINLVAGIILIAFGASGTVGLSSVYRDANLVGLVFLAALVLVGGYEVGKYAEMRHERKKNGN